jgi:hypothetical protein
MAINKIGTWVPVFHLLLMRWATDQNVCYLRRVEWNKVHFGIVFVLWSTKWMENAVKLLNFVKGKDKMSKHFKRFLHWKWRKELLMRLCRSASVFGQKKESKNHCLNDCHCQFVAQMLLALGHVLFLTAVLFAVRMHWMAGKFLLGNSSPPLDCRDWQKATAIHLKAFGTHSFPLSSSHTFQLFGMT